MTYLLIPDTVSAALFDIQDIAYADTPFSYGHMENDINAPHFIKQISHPRSHLAALKIACFAAMISSQSGSARIIKRQSCLSRILNKFKVQPERPVWKTLDRLDIKKDDETVSIYGVHNMIVPNGKSRSGSTGAIKPGIVVHFSEGRRLMDDFIDFFGTHKMVLMEPSEQGVSFAYKSAA